LTDHPVIAFIKNPYFLLSFAILCWGGNFVVARWANLDAPPIALSFWRHAFSVLLVAPFIVPLLRADWPAMRTRLGSFIAIGGLLAAGNTLVYFAVLQTSVVNAALINAGVPVAVVFSHGLSCATSSTAGRRSAYCWLSGASSRW
jgi:drug/metabolite transporter (DMT)-like permease